jgi:hypothetical protein
MHDGVVYWLMGYCLLADGIIDWDYKQSLPEIYNVQIPGA